MASTHKHIRSSTANKRPTTAIADGQIALNTNSSSPGLFFKDSTGATIIKVGPVHIGATAPNATPPSGGSSGNSTGEVWLDTSLTPNGVKIWDGSAWVNATPIGSTTVQGLLELATNAETQTGSDTARAVTPAGLQSKLSDSTSTTSSTTIASSTAVKAAYDLANAALPKSGGTVTGNLEIGTTGSLSFEGATADAFETTIAITDPTADRTITLPDTTGTVVTTGDTGTVTSTMIADGTIVNGDINASAAIAHTKLANITAGSVLMGDASNIPTATALSGDVTVSSSGVTAIGSGVIVNADVNASAAIAGTKISPDFGSQNTTTTGTSTAASFIPTSSTAPTNGVYLPSANNVAISTNGTGRLFVDASGNVGVGSSSPDKWSDANVTQGTFKGVLIGAVNIEGNRTTTSDVGRLAFWQATNRIAYIGAERAGADNSGALRFITTNAGSESERMRLDSSGRLGLGSSDPGNASEGAGLFTRTYVNRTAYFAPVGNYAASIGGVDNTNTRVWLSIDSGYNQASAVSAGIFLSAKHVDLGGTDCGYTIKNLASNNSLVFSQAVTAASTGNATENPRMTLTAGGSLGIGTTSPAGALSVNNASANSVIEVTRGAAGAGYGYTIVGADGATTPALRFQTISNGVWGSEVARFDSSGRLLVGTSSSTSTNSVVQVRSDSGLNMEIFRASADDGAPNIWLSKSRGTAASPSEVSSGDVLGRIVFRGYDGAGWANAAFIEGIADGTWTDGGDTTDNPGALVFSTTADGASSPTERMRITSDGRVLFNTTGTPSASVTGAAFTPQTNGRMSLFSSTSSTASQKHVLFFNPNGEVGSISTNASATAYTTSSDYRLKENIIPLTGASERVLQLKPSRFNFIADPDIQVDGFIAHEAQAVVPECVTGAKDEVDEDGNPVYQGIDQSKLVPLLTAALQEALQKIEDLEARLTEAGI